MIRLRKVSLLNNVYKNRAPLFYWSLGAGFITTVTTLSIGYFIVTFRNRQRTRQALEKEEIERVLDPKGLTADELAKAIVLFEEKRAQEQIQIDNFERYKRLRDKRREQKGLG